MIGKKYLALVAAVVVGLSSAYLVYENTPTLYVRGGHSQFQAMTFEQSVAKHDLTVMGEITSLGVRVMPERNSYHEDDNGVKQVSYTESIPKREVTIRVLDVLDDKIGITSNNVVFYDFVKKALGKKNGQVTEYTFMNTIDYQIGDVGIWTLQYEDNVFKTMGYYGYYPITRGSTTMTTALDKAVGDPPINIESSKKAAKLLSSQTQD